MTLDVVSAMKQYLGDIHTHALRYRMLPLIIQSFIDAAPSGVFLLGSRMTEAVRSRDALKKNMHAFRGALFWLHVEL
jgi:hypothetical protein